MQRFPLHNPEYRQFHLEYERFIQTKAYGNGKKVYYSSNVREFFNFIEAKNIKSLIDVKALDIIAYYEYISQRLNFKREGKLSPASVSRHLFSIRLLFDYLVECGQIDNSPVRLPKFYAFEYVQRNICTVSEIKIMYSHCENKRDTALLSLAYGCGLRRNEMYNLNTNDIFFSKNTLVVREGKYNKSRGIPLSEKVANNLRDYLLNERSNYFKPANFENSPAFLINNSGNRMSGHAINELLKAIITRTENKILQQKNITLHCLRHSIATHLANKGASIEFIQQFLGHSFIDTAHLYSKRRKQNLRNRLLN